MKRSTVPAAAGMLVAAALFVAVVTGCGVSTDAVVDALPQATTTEAPAPTTTVADTAPETTLGAPSSAPSTTGGADPSTTLGGSGALPGEAKDAFMQSCTAGGQDDGTCECVWNAIESELDVDTLMAAGSTETLPDELEEKIVQAMMDCMFDADD